MSDELKNLRLEHYSAEDRLAAREALATILPKHTMGGGYNRINTIRAIVELAQGDLEQLKQLVEHAKLDFRDIILWQQMSREKSGK